MFKLQPGTIFEDSDGYLFWVLLVDIEKNIVYVQDDPKHILPPCTRVIRVFTICDELEDEFTIREPTYNEMGRFLGVNRDTLIDSHTIDTIPAPPSLESISPIPKTV